MVSINSLLGYTIFYIIDQTDFLLVLAVFGLSISIIFSLVNAWVYVRELIGRDRF